jgi:hypothetical protein
VYLGVCRNAVLLQRNLPYTENIIRNIAAKSGVRIISRTVGCKMSISWKAWEPAGEQGQEADIKN